MSSLFDMNSPTGVCAICMTIHAATVPCKYDVLVKNIHALKTNVFSLIQTNKELVDTARMFQKIIQDVTPETERLVTIEIEYRKLVDALRNAKVYSFAASTDPNKPAPLVGVSTDDINAALPPDIDDKMSFESWLKARNKMEPEDGEKT